MVLDSLLHLTGVRPPAWDYAKLQQKLRAFDALVQNHYRYYQFYGHMLVSVVAVYLAHRLGSGVLWPWPIWLDLAVLLLCSILIASSRDALGKYYARTSLLLGTRKGHGHNDQRLSTPNAAHQTQSPSKGRTRVRRETHLVSQEHRFQHPER